MKNFLTIELPAEYGECAPLPDEQFYNLMTKDDKGHIDLNLVQIVLKYYPSLKKFYKRKKLSYKSSPEAINELIEQSRIAEVEFS